MDSYCQNLNSFNNLKKSFQLIAFKPYSTQCSHYLDLSIDKSNELYKFIHNNSIFINDMTTGCKLGGKYNKCHIKNSNIKDILNSFNNSYYNYQNNPSILCSAFSEYTNDLEKLFITGGCYLQNTSFKICKYKYNCF